MKKLMILSIFVSAFLSCGDSCDDLPLACEDVVPTDEECLAFFTRWFYDEETKSCNEISYSGCEQHGFETELACTACECD